MTYPRAITAALRASVATTFERSASLPRGESLHGLAAAAMWHGVVGYVQRFASELELPDTERDALRAARETTVLHHLRTLADLAHLGGVLDGAGVPWLVVKGPTLAEPVHGAVELRAYSDLDVLVAPDRLGDALTALDASGADIVDRNWRLLHRQLKGEVHLLLPSGTPLDLHWHLLNDRATRDRFRIGLAGAFERRRTIRIGGVDVPTLGPADTAVYVALHAVLSGGHRLVWLKDVERLVTARTATPAEIRRRARSWGVELPLAVAVDRAAAAIDGWVPSAVLRRVRPLDDALWSWGSRRLWSQAPAEGQDGAPSLARAVARAVRDRGVSSARSLVTKGVANLREHGPVRGDDGRIAVSDPGSGRYAAGGDAARRAFLEAVAMHPDATRG